MTHTGPEYEYLVQMVNALYQQLLSSKPQCLNTCCYTGKPIEIKEERHVCRPAIQSDVPAGRIQSRLEVDNQQLKENMERLQSEKETLTELINDKEEDNKILRHELKLKDDIVKQLEYDFQQMELEVNDLQKVNLVHNNQVLFISFIGFVLQPPFSRKFII